MDSSESSVDHKRRDRSPSEEKHQTNKLFITNIDGKAEISEIQNELRRLFEKYGAVENLVAKRNRNSEYCFAFADMKDHSAATQCVKAYKVDKTSYDQSYLSGKQIKVEFQDDNKRRKDSNKGCYNCGKMGHFARECHASREYGDRDRGDRRGYHRRSRSPSEDSYRHRHKKHKRRRSDSSERGRSRTPKHKKDRKYRSRDRDEKRKKKHRRSYSSDS